MQPIPCMRTEEQRGAVDGVLFGWIAGVFMLFAEVAVSALEGGPPWAPLQPFRQMVLGTPHLAGDIGPAFLVGFAFHAVLSAIFGAIFCALVNHFFAMRAHRNWAAVIAVGLLYGAVLWFVNLQLIARVLFPTFLTSPQFPQLLIHAFAFGLPLALLYCGAERRMEPAPT